MSSNKLNPILQSCGDFLALISKFRQPEFRYALNTDEFQKLVRTQFESIENKWAQKNITPENIKLAKYALAAFFDELVMTSDWSGRLSWMSRTLQWLYFGEHAAGEGFFTRLTELRQQSPEKIDLLEFYYVCLQLGFEGKYRVHHPERLNILIDELKNNLRRYRELGSLELTPAANKVLSLATISQQIPYWTIVACVVAFMVVIYLGFVVAIHNTANSSEDHLHEYENSIKTLIVEQHNARND